MEIGTEKPEPGQSLLYLSRRDVEDVGLPVREVIGIVEHSLREKGNGRVEMPPKPGIHPRPDSFIHAMPAFVPALAAAGLKWVSGFPENAGQNLPYIGGLLILNDPATGFPLAVMDCTWITAVRTGAATAVAAKYLARRESSVIGILACGVQGRSNLRALAALFPLKQVKAYDISREVGRVFASAMSQELELDIEVADRPKDAVKGSEIVVTSGPILKNPRPTIDPGWLEEGAFACPLDFDSYWTGAALQQADKLATDDLEQFTYYRKLGYFLETPTPYADLGQIVAGIRPGRQDPRERIISINLGLAIEDMATAAYLYQKAVEKNIGRILPL